MDDEEVVLLEMMEGEEWSLYEMSIFLDNRGLSGSWDAGCRAIDIATA